MNIIFIIIILALMYGFLRLNIWMVNNIDSKPYIFMWTFVIWAIFIIGVYELIKQVISGT